MRQAGVRLVSVAISSWAQLEPRDGEFAFGWLDAVLDRLHAGGVRVALATATSSPPPWLATITTATRRSSNHLTCGERG
ncbi:beta-galactosidase [Nonomuraea sp. NPDC049419]|uniref:beta-galactosidase n=1 Tax=Nonomuraea sp. NPDC049419 TaxID=3155772 RepID=UPI00343ADB02